MVYGFVPEEENLDDQGKGTEINSSNSLIDSSSGRRPQDGMADLAMREAKTLVQLCGHHVLAKSPRLLGCFRVSTVSTVQSPSSWSRLSVRRKYQLGTTDFCVAPCESESTYSD